MSFVQLLLQNGANPHLKNYHGQTRLTLAACQGHEHIVRYFFKHISLSALIADQQEEQLFKGLQEYNRKQQGICIITVLKKLLNKKNLSLQADAVGVIPHKIQVLSSIVHDDVDAFKQLTADENLNEPLYYCGTTLLDATICLKAKNIFEYLLAHNVDLSMHDRYGDTALHYAARYGNVKFIEELIKRNAQVNIENNYGNDPLFCAIEAGNIEGAHCLIRLGATVNNLNGYRSSISDAVSSGSLALIKKILNHPHFISNKIKLAEAAGRAIEQKNITVLNMILNSNYITHSHDISLINQPSGNLNKLTLLMKAMDIQDRRIIKHLLIKGSNPDCKNYLGETALMIAADSNKLQSAKMLLTYYNRKKQKQLLDDQSKSGRTALMHAIWNNHHEMVKLLLKFGADIFIKDKYGQDALVHARLNGNKEIENIIKQAIFERMNRPTN